MAKHKQNRSREQKDLRRRRNERAFLFDKDLTRCLGDVDRDDWEFAISISGGDVAAAEVRGRVINEGEKTVGDLLLTATFYDADGRYGGYRQLELPGELAPGEERPFSMAALPVRGTVDAVSVQVDARPPGE